MKIRSNVVDGVEIFHSQHTVLVHEERSEVGQSTWRGQAAPVPSSSAGMEEEEKRKKRKEKKKRVIH
jgi:hypothetical protein